MIAAAVSRARSLRALLVDWLWTRDLRIPRTGRAARLGVLICTVLVALAFVPTVLALLGTAREGHLPTLDAFRVSIAFEVQRSDVARHTPTVVRALAITVVVGWVFNFLVRVLDLVLYRRVFGQRFPWETMATLMAVAWMMESAVAAMVFGPLQSLCDRLLAGYTALVHRVPTLIELTGVPALILASLATDFAWYWAHRFAHRNRLLWNLGHVSHHRVVELTEVTTTEDATPISLLSPQRGGLAGFVYLPIARLFTHDMTTAGWALVVAMAIEQWLLPAHSPVLYKAETLFAPLRGARWLLVTPGVHRMHHSRDPRHDVSHGCNFAARWSVWDRLFGTYIEPTTTLPETGLFSPTADACRTPVRYFFLPFVRMYRELRRNAPRHWPKIVLGPTSYEPPVSSGLSH